MSILDSSSKPKLDIPEDGEVRIWHRDYYTYDAKVGQWYKKGISDTSHLWEKQFTTIQIPKPKPVLCLRGYVVRQFLIWMIGLMPFISYVSLIPYSLGFTVPIAFIPLIILPFYTDKWLKNKYDLDTD